MSSRFVHICSIFLYFIPFEGWIIFYYICIPHFGYPSIHWWMFGLLPPFSCCEYTMNMGVQTSVWASAFNFGVYTQEVELLDHIVILIFWENLTRVLILNFKNSFSRFISGNTSIHSFVRVPVSEHKLSCGTKVSAQVGQQEMVITWIALPQVNWAELDGQKFSLL